MAKADLTGFVIKSSPIHGYGIFAEKEFFQSEKILEIGKSKLVVFLNHSCQPNCVLIKDILYVGESGVVTGEEITVDYRSNDHEYVWESIQSEGGCNCQKPCKKE